jgi:hypothetical protein
VTGVKPTMEFKAALDIDYDNESAAQILDKIMYAIEQTPEHNLLHEYDTKLKESKSQPTKNDS